MVTYIFNPFGFIFSYATSVQILASSLSPLHDITFISVSVENKSLRNLMICQFRNLCKGLRVIKASVDKL